MVALNHVSGDLALSGLSYWICIIETEVTENWHHRPFIAVYQHFRVTEN